MSNQELSCGLDYCAAPDMHACLTEALRASYSFITCPLVHPRFRRHHIQSCSGVPGFTRSDMMLSPQDWTVRVVGKLSPYLNVDVTSPVVRQRHEDCMVEELTYCRGLGLPAIMLKIHGRETTNLSRILQTFYETSYHPSFTWAHVPIVCHRKLHSQKSDSPDNDEAWEEAWNWWSLFHRRMNWDKRVGVVLELSADVPSEAVLKRWLGEPVRAVLIPTSIFLNNKKGFPVLSKSHQQMIVSFVERDAQLILSGARRSNIDHYMQYLYRVWQRRDNQADDPMLNYAKGWEDYLQIPLQPLADNLDSHTYNVFEKDPIKYDQYQKAIAQALTHLNNKKKTKMDNSEEESTAIRKDTESDGDKIDCDEVITVMVLGAGRGPLVRATFNAADITKTKVKVIAVEKNPCAVVVLAAQAREIWQDRDMTVMAGDMRHIDIKPKADIIVSELLGSWGDNELSPECLDGAAGLLKPGGISIPCSYSSYVAPIMSPRLWAAARGVVGAGGTAPSPDKNMETLWVVYMQNKHDIGETKPLFTFDHPAKGMRDNEGEEIKDYRNQPAPDNRRSLTLTWTVEQDNIMHGFGGYFDCKLFGDEMISIEPTTHSPGMISWFPVFIPIKTPLRVSKGEVIKATFWRCVNTRKVWYEWIVEVGNQMTPLHNSNGRSSEMFL